MFTLTFKKPTPPIRSLAAVELPDFTILTGVNGAGKSCLLRAVQAGDIEVTGLLPGKSQIGLFDFNLSPEASSRESAIQIAKKRMETARHAHIELGKFRTALFDLGKTTGLSLQQLEKMVIDREHESEVKSGRRRAAKTLFDHIRNAFGGHAALAERFLAYLRKQRRTVILDSTLDDILVSLPASSEELDVFKHAFSRQFLAYYKRQEQNLFTRFKNKERGTSLATLTDEQFVEQFGPPPWELANRVFKMAQFPYTITAPADMNDDSFVAKLSRDADGNEIDFTGLSSGEKIIMSLALCLYNVSDPNVVARYPKMLLFDEIDAPLHPSMTRQMLDVIQRVLVKEQGIKVILTTHSPSTVALAPAESIYRLDANPHRITHVTRSDAVQTLTSGYITVGDSTRFVIVEARSDRETYTDLFTSLVSGGVLEKCPGLVFVQASENKNREGGGSSQVKDWAKKLPEAGLTSLLGLIDRDKTNFSSGTIHVLQRYAIENYLLDPVIIYAVLMNGGYHKNVIDIGIENQNYFELQRLCNEELQVIASHVCNKVIEAEPSLASIKGDFRVRYQCGSTVQLPLWMKEERGHSLAGHFRKAFKDGRGPLVANNDCEKEREMLLRRLPKLIPDELVTTLRGLQAPQMGR